MPDTANLGRWIVLLGIGIALVGAAVWAAGRLGLPLGRLPGDLHFQRGGATFFIPCATSILLSLLLTVVLNLVLRWFNR
jgi:hypothetical protein